MTFASLPNWLPTAHGLHSGAQIVGAVRKLVTPPQPLALHLALGVTPDGLSSGRLPGGGELLLDLRVAALLYRPADGEVQRFALGESPTAAVSTALFTALAHHDLAEFVDSPHVDRDAMAAAFAARDIAAPDLDALFADETPAIDAVAAAHYATAFDSVHAALARFRGGLRGMQSPLVVWPHHFDLSGLWFVRDQLDDYLPHMNFGFAPYSPGFDEPYLYVTAYPLPDEVAAPRLPPGAYWHSDGWRGIALPYAALVGLTAPENTLWRYLQTFYERLRPLLARQEV